MAQKVFGPVKFAIAIGTLLYGHVVIGKRANEAGERMKKKGFASGVEKKGGVSFRP
jgi:hypothetical protein